LVLEVGWHISVQGGEEANGHHVSSHYWGGDRKNPLLLEGEESKSITLAERMMSQLSVCRVDREFFGGHAYDRIGG
jgi:hypothetical protein